MKILVGSTGFVGSSLCNKICFDFFFNSKNIMEFSNVPNGCDLYLACLSAKKWAVNQNTQADFENMLNIIDILKTRIYRNIFLISTIDVYSESPLGVNEDYIPRFSKLSYGQNRYIFEMMTQQYLAYESIKIFRLPALFGDGLKKNVLFDLLNNNQIEKINFNSVFQWYDINDLHRDIHNFHDYKVINLFTEPLETKVLCSELFNMNVDINQSRIEYNYKTKTCSDGYIQNKDIILEKLRKFKNEYINQQYGMGAT